MTNCQENACPNFQAAICLHCNNYLCIKHIVEHGTILLKEGDKLCEQINELAEHLNVCSKQIPIARDEAVHKANLWRQNHIDKIETKYAKKIQIIESEKDHLIELENQLTQRLIKEAKQPIEFMQTRQNASSQSLEIIRRAIENIVQESAQLDLYVKSLQSQLTEPSINPTDVQSMKTTDLPLNQSTSTIASNSSSNQTTTIQTVITSSVIPKPAKTITAVAAASSKTIIKRPPIYLCKSLVNFFKDISGSTDRNIEEYIVKGLNQAKHVNNMMIVLLSLLEAQHLSKIPLTTNPNVLTHHIAIIKKYIKGSEHQLTVIASIQVFINSLRQDEQKSSLIMTNLLRFFLNNHCISKEIIFDWYKNGQYYGYPAFQNAMLWAKPFIDELNTNIN